MSAFLTRYGFRLVLAAMLGAAVWSLNGALGLRALVERYEEAREGQRIIEALKEQNKFLEVDNQRLADEKERIEEEIRRRMEYLKEGETKYNYPDQGEGKKAAGPNENTPKKTPALSSAS